MLHLFKSSIALLFSKHKENAVTKKLSDRSTDSECSIFVECLETNEILA